MVNFNLFSKKKIVNVSEFQVFAGENMAQMVEFAYESRKKL